MEGHSADEPPQGILLVQVGAQSRAARANFPPDRGIDVAPGRAKRLGIEIFETSHRRGVERQLGELLYGRRLDPFRFRLALAFPEMTELGHIALREAARERESRWQRSLDLRGREVKQPCSLAAIKFTLNPPGSSGRHGRTVLRLKHLDAKSALEGDVEVQRGGHGAERFSMHNFIRQIHPFLHEDATFGCRQGRVE